MSGGVNCVVPRNRVFLSAEWRYLAMLNYQIDPAFLAPRVPRGTELDLFDGNAFVSIVGFRFLATRVRGLPIPFHRNFEEVNLRFYVRRCENSVVKRGVVFIQEIVPRRAIAAVARMAYNENYKYVPMGHRIQQNNIGGTPRLSVEYWWRLGSRWECLNVQADGPPQEIIAGSEQEFIAEHYWGYATQRDGGSKEYRVDHARWRAWNVVSSAVDADVAALCGPELAGMLKNPPHSAFLAEGSAVMVYAGDALKL